MPNVFYYQTSSANVSHLKELEEFLDQNHEEMSQTLHKDLMSVYETANSEAAAELKANEMRIEELEGEINSLQEQIKELMEATKNG